MCTASLRVISLLHGRPVGLDLRTRSVSSNAGGRARVGLDASVLVLCIRRLQVPRARGHDEPHAEAEGKSAPILCPPGVDLFENFHHLTSPPVGCMCSGHMTQQEILKLVLKEKKSGSKSRCNHLRFSIAFPGYIYLVYYI